ncbi:MAG: hypothetical protein WDW38_001446 [Sanguina aurantia]
MLKGMQSRSAVATQRQGCGIAQQTRSACLKLGCSRSVLGSRQSLHVAASWFKGGGGGGDSSSKDDAARKSLENMMGGKGKSKQPPPAGKPVEPKPVTPPATTGGGGFGGMFSASSGDGGGSNFFSGGGGGGGGGGEGAAAEDEEPIHVEFFNLMKGVWIVFWNLAAFLAAMSFLHRTLGWCAQTELLVQYGAPQQALERVASAGFDWLEWFQRVALGWDIPDPLAGRLRVFEVLKYTSSDVSSFSMQQLRYPLDSEEKKLLNNAYGRRHFERVGGVKGDVDFDKVQDVIDKYEPREADLRKYRQAKAEGRLAEYHEAKTAAAAAHQGRGN